MLWTANALVLVLALAHAAFLFGEMFRWRQLRWGFGFEDEPSEETLKLAANMGLYNGFLAAGLFWGWYANDFALKIFFLACVAIAGLFGWATVDAKLFRIQGAPALIALGLFALTR